MTVAHSALTGSNLHEPKGIAAAAVNKAYISDGAGSGAWQKLTANQLTGTGNSFGAQLLHVRDEKTAGSDGGTLSSGSWQTRTLNTSVTNEIASASLASNQISLPAGTYYIEASAPSLGVDGHKVKLRNVTDSLDIIIGSTAFAGVSDTVNTSSVVK